MMVSNSTGFHPKVGKMYWKTVGTSGYLTAFNPYASAISCGL